VKIGPKLARPHADTLKGSKRANMKELRADTADKVLRVAFAFDPDRAGILLVAGDKSAGLGTPAGGSAGTIKARRKVRSGTAMF
jgi:hypothetical protein